MKTAVLGSDAVMAVLSGEHMPPPLRPFAWLGTLRPSDAVGGVIAKHGPEMPQLQLARLESTKVLAPVLAKCWLRSDVAAASALCRTFCGFKLRLTGPHKPEQSGCWDGVTHCMCRHLP